MPEQLTVDARALIDAAREIAKRSIELMRPGVELNMKWMIVHGTAAAQAQVYGETELRIRSELVMDCFLTGAATAVKMLIGDFSPETWGYDYDHEGRLTELLRLYSNRMVSAGMPFRPVDEDPSKSFDASSASSSARETVRRAQ